MQVSPLSLSTLGTQSDPENLTVQSVTGNFITDHTVVKGDTLYSISKSYGYPISQIAAWNNLHSPYNLSVGQQLRFYPASSTQKTVASHNTPPNYHTVARKETLYRISQRYGYSVAQIAAWNKLSPPYNLSVGKRLQVSPTITGTPNTTRRRYHIVKSGDTLKSIATKYGVTVYELSKFNGIGSPYTIYPGQKLSFVSP